MANEVELTAPGRIVALTLEDRLELALPDDD